MHFTTLVAGAQFAPKMPKVHDEKPEKFNGTNFKLWQQKMLFYLTMMDLDRFLKEEPPLLSGESNT